MGIAHCLQGVLHEPHRLDDVGEMLGHNRGDRLSNGALLSPFKRLQQLRRRLLELAQLLLPKPGAVQPRIVVWMKEPVDVHASPPPVSRIICVTSRTGQGPIALLLHRSRSWANTHGVELILYSIWFLIPLIFYLLALWGRLEQMSSGQPHHHVIDLLHQGHFTLAVAVVSVAVDRFLLPKIVAIPALDFVSPLFLQIVTFPAIALILASAFGPSGEIRVGRPTGRPPAKRSGGDRSC